MMVINRAFLVSYKVYLLRNGDTTIPSLFQPISLIIWPGRAVTFYFFSF